MNINISLINSLSPKRFEWNLIEVIFKLDLVIDGWSILCEIACKWLSSLNLTNGKSTLVQVMAMSPSLRHNELTFIYSHWAWPCPPWILSEHRRRGSSGEPEICCRCPAGETWCYGYSESTPDADRSGSPCDELAPPGGGKENYHTWTLRYSKCKCVSVDGVIIR